MQGWLYDCEDIFFLFCYNILTAVQPALHNYFVFNLIMCISGHKYLTLRTTKSELDKSVSLSICDLDPAQ